MSAALFSETILSEVLDAISPVAQLARPAGPQAVTTIPTWEVGALVDGLNGVPMVHDRKTDDPAEALRLYADDVRRAAAFYRELGCRMVLPYMDEAKRLRRAQGELAPQNIVLVGAAGGMGVAVARHAASLGATVNLIDIPDAQGKSSAALLELAKACSALCGADKVQVLPVHATDDRAMAAAMHLAAERGGGRIDLLFHAAGIFGDKRAFEISEAHLSFLLDVNVRSTLISINSALPYLVKSKNPSFVFVSSMAATEFVGNQAEYCFSKHHQSESMNVLGHLLSHHLKIKITELRFGHVFTPMCLGRGLEAEKMIQVDNVAELVWHIAKVPPQMRFKAVEVTPTERLEGEILWPEAELAGLAR